MATYRIKRKQYGLVDGVTGAAANTLGGISTAAGKTLDSGVGGLVGGVAGAHLGGAAIGAGIDAVTGGILGGPISSLLGYAAGYKLGNAATREVGKGLKEAGQDFMQ